MFGLTDRCVHICESNVLLCDVVDCVCVQVYGGGETITQAEALRLFVVANENSVDSKTAVGKCAVVFQSVFPDANPEIRKLRYKLQRVENTAKGRNESSPVRVEFLSKRITHTHIRFKHMITHINFYLLCVVTSYIHSVIWADHFVCVFWNYPVP